MSQYLTIEEAARMLRISPFAMRDKCKKKLIPAKKIPGSKKWLINSNELKKFLP